MWNHHQLLIFIKSLHLLNLQELYQELVAILALIMGCRMQTISIMKFSDFSVVNQFIHISAYLGPYKNLGIEGNPALHISFFTEKPHPCVAISPAAYVQ